MHNEIQFVNGRWYANGPRSNGHSICTLSSRIVRAVAIVWSSREQRGSSLQLEVGRTSNLGVLSTLSSLIQTIAVVVQFRLCCLHFRSIELRRSAMLPLLIKVFFLLFPFLICSLSESDSPFEADKKENTRSASLPLKDGRTLNRTLKAKETSEDFLVKNSESESLGPE